MSKLVSFTASITFIFFLGFNRDLFRSCWGKLFHFQFVSTFSFRKGHVTIKSFCKLMTSGVRKGVLSFKIIDAPKPTRLWGKQELQSFTTTSSNKHLKLNLFLTSLSISFTKASFILSICWSAMVRTGSKTRSWRFLLELRFKIKLNCCSFHDFYYCFT